MSEAKPYLAEVEEIVTFEHHVPTDRWKAERLAGRIQTLIAGRDDDLAKSAGMIAALERSRDQAVADRRELEAVVERLTATNENYRKVVAYWTKYLGYEKFNSTVYPALSPEKAEEPPLVVRLRGAIGEAADFVATARSRVAQPEWATSLLVKLTHLLSPEEGKGKIETEQPGDEPEPPETVCNHIHCRNRRVAPTSVQKAAPEEKCGECKGNGPCYRCKGTGTEPGK